MQQNIDKSKSKIIEKTIGIMSDYITNIKYWDIVEKKYGIDILYKLKIESAIKIICENKASLVLNIEPLKIQNEKSKYRRFVNKYGGQPEINMLIDTYVENGLNKINID